MLPARQWCSVSCANLASPRGVAALSSAERSGTNNAGWKSVPSYKALHRRLTRALGGAGEHACADCGQPGYDWSYDGLDPDEVSNADGQMYSLAAGHYVPRCKRCHAAYDARKRPSGERHGASKLTDAQRRGIRASVGASVPELAERFGVDPQTIRNARAWADKEASPAFSSASTATSRCR
jgi:hypothetical protein